MRREFIGRTDAKDEISRELDMPDTTNGYCPGFRTSSCSRTEGRLADGTDVVGNKTIGRTSIAELYRLLRVRHQSPMFQAIPGSLWLAR